MNDIFHNIGVDVLSSVTGDLQPVDGTVRGQQRVLRRLLTNPGDYIWHTDYGGGLGQRVGDVSDIPAITSLIRAQLQLEEGVAQTPEPQIAVAAIQGGISVSIRYTDTDSKTPQTLSFNVNK